MIEIGQAAAQDPVLNFTSGVATQLLSMATRQPPARRQSWLRSELNKATPGMGDDFVSKARELRRRGRAQDQAVFDALRLVFANRLATKLGGRGGLSGLGASTGDISATFCGVNGAIGGAGVITTAAMQNPAGTEAVGTAMQRILQGQGCSPGEMAAQAAALQAQLTALQASQGASVSVGASTDALPWIIGGVVTLGLLGTVGYLALRKKS